MKTSGLLWPSTIARRTGSTIDGKWSLPALTRQSTIETWTVAQHAQTGRRHQSLSVSIGTIAQRLGVVIVEHKTLRRRRQHTQMYISWRRSYLPTTRLQHKEYLFCSPMQSAGRLGGWPRFHRQCTQLARAATGRRCRRSRDCPHLRAATRRAEITRCSSTHVLILQNDGSDGWSREESRLSMDTRDFTQSTAKTPDHICNQSVAQRYCIASGRESPTVTRPSRREIQR